MELFRQLAEGVKQLNLDLSQAQLNQLTELQNQLMKWTKAFNLTAITDPDQVLRLHLLDSLAVVPYWQATGFSKTLDVGTGAGFPGLPLAIALPDQAFHLLDSNGKKTRFILQQVHHLGLTNVTVHHSRVEQHAIKDYDCVTSRAFASLVDMVKLTQPLLKSGGRWMAMKGIYDPEEVKCLPATIREIKYHNLNIPGSNAERCLIELVNNS